MPSVFGKHLWELPALELSFPQTPDRYRYFARFLLEGSVRLHAYPSCAPHSSLKIFPGLKKYEPHLKNKPHLLNKPWVKVADATWLLHVADPRRTASRRCCSRLSMHILTRSSSCSSSGRATRHVRECPCGSWCKQPPVLLAAYCMWLDTEHQTEVTMMWPPIDSKAR